jgi:hypothetical protein
MLNVDSQDLEHPLVQHFIFVHVSQCSWVQTKIHSIPGSSENFVVYFPLQPTLNGTVVVVGFTTTCAISSYDH